MTKDATATQLDPATSLIGRTLAEGVLTLTLQRPPVNALDEALVLQLRSALREADSDPEVRALVISAEGPCFAAGADIRMLQRLTRAEFSAFVTEIQALFGELERSTKPVIAAVEGAAMGGGFELALACDLRIAGGDARFGVPEVQLGLLPGAGGTQRLARALPKGRALDLLLTARTLSTAEALAWGLIERAVPAGSAEAEAQRLTAGLATGAPLAIAAIKECVLSGRDASLAAGLALERETARRLAASADFTEGLAAFLDKRPPVFQGV